jgi:N-acylneuraminate cytidylyltransferase
MNGHHTWNGPRLAVIPARGGSRRVPSKNIRKMLGKPLIAYTIEAAFDSGLFDYVVVSTDREDIADIARQYGADVPFLRDVSLADDHTPVSLVTVDTLERLDPEGNRFAHVAQLMANCPLRTGDDIRNSYRQFVLTGSESQVSVTQYGWQNPWWAFERNETFRLRPLFDGRLTQRSQDLPDLFCPTGAVWWAKTNALRRHRTYHMETCTGWTIPWQRAVDIDTQEDWELAELLMRLYNEMEAPAQYAV